MKSFFYILILSAAIGLYSCYNNPVDNPVQNQRPKTGLFLYPDSTISQQPSRLKISWWGDDPDGIVIGFYYSWDGINWNFTTSNDSVFALQIGVTDTVYTFTVAAVDNGGNNVYDSEIIQNGINFGPEPFTDLNGNGVYDPGEPFIDIGLIDDNPPSIVFPIKNSSPEIVWNNLSFLPDTSFPVMSFGWEAFDIDGDHTISKINIALNDTAAENIVSLNGAVRRITIRPKDRDYQNLQMQILIDGSTSSIVPDLLQGLVLDANNKFFVQSEDISGAKSKWISLPEEGKSWYVKKPVGELLLVDDYNTIDNAHVFYTQMFDSLNLSGKYDVYDFHKNRPPFLNVTFLETVKLFDYLLWYSDNSPSLDLASLTSQRYLDEGGKIFFSIQFPQNFDMSLIQGFLPVNDDSSDYRSSLSGNTKIISSSQDYPDLQTDNLSLFRIRSFYISSINVIKLYKIENNPRDSYIGFTTDEKNLFFLGLPLHRVNGGEANVKTLMEKVLFQDFGLMP
jgi:hypothetical protein